MEKRLTRIDPISFAVVYAFMGAIMFLIMMLIFMAFGSLFAGMAGSADPDLYGGGPNPFAMIFSGGILMLILGPIFYAIFGFILGLFMAVVYNMVAKMIGGIKVHTQDLD